MHFLQTQPIQLLFDPVNQRLNRGHNLRIQGRPAGVSVQGRHDDFVVWFQIGQHG
jgi:hypothetical protein